MKKALIGILLIGGLFVTLEAKPYHAIKGESKIVYHLKHPLHDVKGVSADVKCFLDISDDSLLTKVSAKTLASAFNSGNSNRDSHVLELLEALKYPYVEFESDSVSRTEKGYQVFGQLTFHGVKRPVKFEAIPTYIKDRIRITSGFTVKLSEFKIKRPTLLMIPTEDALHIEILLVIKGP